MFKERLSFKMAGEKSPMHFLDALSPMDPFYELLSMKYVDQNYDADPLGQRTVKPSSPLQNEPCREFVEEEEFDKPYSEGHDDTSVEGITDLQQPDGKAINESKLENVPDGTAVTTGQTEMGSRQFGDQCTTGQSRTASEFPIGSSRVDGELDAGTGNEIQTNHLTKQIILKTKWVVP
ncbi:uncharacterized protein [Macrobrachium rosenbergii]|uniref:uncharacterized protein isoform X3 n=1 Tax=Macrobrachium rosenbergii TaxID=79674 RepID=UPI0034D4C506